MPRKKATGSVPAGAGTQQLEQLNGDSIDRLVSQSYDESPEVRMRAAEELSKISEDPRAVFALIELSGDKEEAVSDRAKAAIGMIRDDGTALSLEKFFAEERVAKAEDVNEARQKLMPSIERLFERADPGKAKRLREKLMPSIEKLFSKKGMQLKLSEEQAGSGKTSRIEGLFSVSGSQASSEQQQAAGQGAAGGQSAIERMMQSHSQAQQQPAGTVQPHAHGSELEHALSGIEKMIDFVPSEEEKERIEEALVEIEKKAKDEEGEEAGMGEMKTSFILESKQDIFKKALEVITATPGITERLIRQEEKRLVDLIKNDVHAAFQMAWLKARGPALEKISNLKLGMKNICTRELVVVAAKDIEYKKGRKSTPMRKLVVADHTGNFPLYLPIVRGRGIMAGDIVKLEKAFVDYYEYTGEVALSIMPRGKIIIMK